MLPFSVRGFSASSKPRLENGMSSAAGSAKVKPPYSPLLNTK